MAKLSNAEHKRIYWRNVDPEYKAILLKRNADQKRKRRAAAVAAKVAADAKAASIAEAAKISSAEADADADAAKIAEAEAALKAAAATPCPEMADIIARSDPPVAALESGSPKSHDDASSAVCAEGEYDRNTKLSKKAESMRMYRRNMDPEYKATLLKRNAEQKRKRRAALKAAAVAATATEAKLVADAESAKITSAKQTQKKKKKKKKNEKMRKIYFTRSKSKRPQRKCAQPNSQKDDINICRFVASGAMFCNERCANVRCENQVVKDWKKVVTRDAEEKGKGVYAILPIKKDEVIVPYLGVEIDQKELDRQQLHEDMLYIASCNGKLIDSRGTNCPARYINHSCDPNCQLQQLGVDGTNQMHLYIVASKRISIGEELTYDYQWYPTKLRTPTQCLCGAVKCRGTIEVSI